MPISAASFRKRECVPSSVAITPTTREDSEVSRDNREKRDLHALTEDGMVLCNPRDREAAHRAQMEGIATDDHAAVTCRKCRDLLYQLPKEKREE